MRAAKEKEFDDQNATVVELECKIGASENILQLLKKRAASINVGQKADASAGGAARGDKQAKAFDLGALLKKLRVKIKQIHLLNIN